MTAYSTSWEPRLFALAQYEPENEPGSEAVSADAAALARAYAYCDAIAQQHSHTFYTASRLLPSEKRRAIRSLYALSVTQPSSPLFDERKRSRSTRFSCPA